MSSETSAWAKEQRCGDPVTKAVLMEIANWAKPTGICEFLSVKRISEVTEVSTRTVQRHIARLENEDEAAGGLRLLKRIHRHRDDGGQGANCFELVGYEMPAGAPVIPRRQSVTPPRQDVTPPRQIDGEPGDTVVTRLGDKIRTPSPSDDGETPAADLFKEEGDGSNLQKAQVAPAEPAKAHRLPDDWAAPPLTDLPPSTAELVRQWPKGAYQARCETFRMHWQSEERPIGRKKNWMAALGKWLINDHAQVMRDNKAGVSFERLAPKAADAGPAAPVVPVPQRALEGGTADRLREELRGLVGGPAYVQWFEPAALLIDQDTLRVVTRSPFMASYIEANFQAQLLQAAERAGVETSIVRTTAAANAVMCRPSTGAGDSQ